VNLDGHDAKAAIRQFIVEDLAASRGVASIADEDSLTERGIVDSLGIFQLIAFLEEAFGIRIEDEEITLENFASIPVITRFVMDQVSRR
jgi:acyl carrier protein